jgi:hypothetical protein
MTETEPETTIEVEEETQEEQIYADRKAVFDAAHLILDASDNYEGETRIKKWAIVLAAHNLNGNGTAKPKPTKARFSLKEDELKTAIEKANEITIAIKAKESLAQEEERKHAEMVMQNTPAPAPDPKEIKRQADVISALQDKPMEKFIAAYKLSHIGHYQILRSIIYAVCLKSSGTTKGLQPVITGKRGSGKSHGARTAIHLHPTNGLYAGTVSDKYLYHVKPADKTTFYMDDVDLTDNFTSFLKRKQTEFQQDTTYGTQDGPNWVTISVGKRMVFITTATSQQGGNQLSDRALTIDIKNEETDDKEFYEFEKERRMKGLPEFPECDEVWLCRDMLEHIAEREFHVMLPSLDFSFYHDRRLIGQCYDMMEASAILNYLSRDHDINDEGVIVVKATKDDLANALDFDMFKFADKDADDRLLKSERAFDVKVQSLLKGNEKMTWTQKQLALDTKTNESTLRKYLYGHGKNAESFEEGDGLCGKTCWYHIDKQKDEDAEAVKNFVTVYKHTYNQIGESFAWIVDCPAHRTPPTQ